MWGPFITGAFCSRTICILILIHVARVPMQISPIEEKLLNWYGRYRYLAEVGLDAGVAEGEICERHYRVATHLAAHRVPRRMDSVLNLCTMVPIKVICERHYRLATHLAAQRVPRRMDSVLNLCTTPIKVICERHGQKEIS